MVPLRLPCRLNLPVVKVALANSESFHDARVAIVPMPRTRPPARIAATLRPLCRLVSVGLVLAVTQVPFLVSPNARLSSYTVPVIASPN